MPDTLTVYDPATNAPIATLTRENLPPLGFIHWAHGFDTLIARPVIAHFGANVIEDSTGVLLLSYGGGPQNIRQIGEAVFEASVEMVLTPSRQRGDGVWISDEATAIRVRAVVVSDYTRPGNTPA